MTQEEYRKTGDAIKLKLLNSFAAGLFYKAQETYDILELLLAEDKNGLFCMDKFCLVERQAQIVKLEADKLWERCRKLEDALRPKFDNEP